MKRTANYMIWPLLGVLLWLAADPLKAVSAPASVPQTPANRPAAIADLPTTRPVATIVPTTMPSANHVQLRPHQLPIRFVPVDPNAGRVAKPTVAIANNSCVTSECHATIKNFKVVHGPVNVNACDSCHKLADEKTHHFVQKREKAEQCSFCHQTRKPDDAFLHKPVSEGDCIGCHNPHGGNDKRFLHGNTMSDLCFRCHEDTISSKTAVHGPVALGACDACHQPHSSKFPKLVNAQGTEFCYSCHDQMKTQMVSAKFVHKVVSDKGCSDCHDVHASNHRKQLVAEPQDLCVTCHKPIQQLAMSAPVKHEAVTMKDGCMNCHTPHASDRAKLMKVASATACLACHDKPITVVLGNSGAKSVAIAAANVNEHKATDAPGPAVAPSTLGANKPVVAAQTAATSIVPSMAILKDPAQYKHGPLRDGDCTGCHAPHGGDVSRLLAKPFPDTFYQPFDVDKYSLCFSCHDKQLVLQEKTNALTKFRNGDQNLHYLHVNKQDKGRSCRACHAIHSSSQPLHLRETVPFGKWEMPVSFQQTATGGSCKPGCHAVKVYDRQTPAPNPPPAPATPPRPASIAKDG